jgi:hypothetical protein
MRDIDKLFLFVVALVVVLCYLASLPDWPKNDNGLFSSDGATKSRDGVAYKQFTANETVIAVMTDMQHNRSIHISANATENWTVWKGDKLVAYIPRGA